MRLDLPVPSSRLPALAAVNSEPAEPTFRGLAHFANPLMKLLTKRDWRAQEKVPATGGVLFVSNHISKFDPIALGHYLIWSGRWPRFLGKVEIFRSLWVGWLARGCGQIPVERNTERAADALLAAREAIAAGKAVCIYPEGTITADPQEWPMTPRTGAARLALEVRCPVVPIGQWGANKVMPGKGRSIPRFFPRHTMHMLCGDPVDLSDLYDLERSPEVISIASYRMLEALKTLVAEVRGEPAPPDYWDMRLGKRVPPPRLQP